MPIADTDIRFLAKRGMVTPFRDYSDSEQNPLGISAGLSSCGYDLRLDEDIKILNEHLPENLVIDPLRSDPKQWEQVEIVQDIDPKTKKVCRVAYIPPETFFLCSSVEYIKMPDFLCGIVMGKSTYARNALGSFMTPIEPSWEGHITLEFKNELKRPLKVYVDYGIAQLLLYPFGNMNAGWKTVPEKTYSNKSGKYQKQEKGVVLSR